MSLRWMLMLGLVLGVALIGCPGDDDDDDDATAADDDATPGDDDDATPTDDDDATPTDDDDATPADDDDATPADDDDATPADDDDATPADDDDATPGDDDDATPGDDDDATPGDDDDATPGDDDDATPGDDDDATPGDDDDATADDDDDDTAAAQCLTGGTSINPPGAGSCASRYVINLASEPSGTVVTHAAGAAGADEADFNAPGYCAAPPVGTARDIVYHVRGPAGTQAIEICVETAAGGDPRIAVLEDPSCGQPANLCVDDQPSGVSEFLRADRGTVFYSDDTYVVISEMVHSGADFTVSFQALQ